MPNYRAQATQVARRYGLDPKVFTAMIQQESGFNPNARSGAGAQGIAQFMPATARQYGVTLGDNNARDDLEGAARYLSDNLKKYGSYERALSVYNSGRPDAYKDPNFAGGQTYNYVRSILGQGKGSPSSFTNAPAKESYRTVPGVDNSQARRQLEMNYFNTSHDPNALLNLASGLRGAQDTPARRVRVQTPSTGEAGGSGRVVKFDGKPVLAKFLPELRWARANGWKGTVTSGVRSRQEQLAAAQKFGLQHYGPAGPLGSNHVEGHAGAVDVSDPNGLDAVLRRYPGPRLLRRGMADDPVHFSPTGH